MKRYRWGGLVAVGLALALAGCSSSHGTTMPTPDDPSGPIPANSPLTTCVDLSPAKAKPVDAVVAKHLTDGRISSALKLDDGNFRAMPPPRSAEPKIGAAQAYCNLLAGVDSSNSHIIDSVPAHGVSFGLGVLTVATSLEQNGQGFVPVGNELPVGPDGKGIAPPVAHLKPYRDRLAWIAVFEPEVAYSCPVGVAPGSATTRPSTPKRSLPAYEILAIDANTGANGILYSTTTNNPCGMAGTRAPNYVPAKMFVSVPWALTSRGSNGKSATITYAVRPCDDRGMPFDSRTGKPIVTTDRNTPALVAVNLERTLTTCGPAVKVPVTLRNELSANDLPEHLVHAPVGAQDTRD